jgi:hypothetical protein
MSLESAPQQRWPHLPHTRRPLARHWPALSALLGIGVIYAIVSEQLSLGPRWLLLGLIIVLVIPLGFALRHGLFRLTRMIAFVMLGLVTIAEVLSTSALVLALTGTSLRISQLPHETALGLLRDAALIWLVNILTFSLWYWELDSGGPGRRHREGYHSHDFIFPQLTFDQPAGAPWCPHYVDYLFLAFNTSTAFSPTDTLVLSRRAKLLLMTQSLISLMVLAIIAARAINTL